MLLNSLFKPHPKQTPLSADDIEVRIWGFVVVAVTMILCFIVVSILYSVTFVTQPIKSMAPIDQAYTKMLNDIVLLIVGGIGGVMSKRAVGAAANRFGTPTRPNGPCQPGGNQYGGYSPAPSVPQASGGMPDFNWMGYQNPDLDESWTPGPPPTTPPDYIDPDKEEIALERSLAKNEV